MKLDAVLAELLKIRDEHGDNIEVYGNWGYNVFSVEYVENCISYKAFNGKAVFITTEE